MVYLIQGITLGFSAGVSPGPFHAFLISQTLKNGWQRALPAVLAPLLSDGPIIALVLVVLTQMPGVVLRGLQVVGGVFLLMLAREAYRDFRTAREKTAVETGSARESLQKAALLNLLNPNPYIFWGVIGGPILLDAWREAAGHGVSFIAGFYAAMVSVFAGLVIVLATARHLGDSVTRTLSGISAVALFAFGIYQIVTGLFG
ncbi:MAG: LysE family transporter [Anaerolineae bacterium]|nr:LysE family transporter [Anaerolineae bacterium]